MHPDARPIFICEIEQFGGAERALLALVRWLNGQGLPSYLLTYRDHCGLAQYAEGPLEVVDLHCTGGVRAKVAALKAHLATRGVSAPKLLCSGYQPALHATLAGARGFHDLMHDTPALFGDEETRDWKGRLRIAVSNMIIGAGLRSGGQTMVTSEFLKRDCRKDFGVEARIVRMGGMVGEPRVREARGFGPGVPLRMLSVCRVEANKRIDWMLRGLARLEAGAVGPLGARLSELVDWRLEVVGKGSLIEALEEMARGLGIAERVRFYGFVGDTELDELMGEADLFLMPAVQGYGIPAVESIARGGPVLLHRESGVSDILLDTPWATVLSGGEDEMAGALAQAVEAVLAGRQRGVEPPRLPTEAEWAGEVARLCGWVERGR